MCRGLKQKRQTFSQVAREYDNLREELACLELPHFQGDNVPKETQKQITRIRRRITGIRQRLHTSLQKDSFLA